MGISIISSLRVGGHAAAALTLALGSVASAQNSTPQTIPGLDTFSLPSSRPTPQTLPAPAPTTQPRATPPPPSPQPSATPGARATPQATATPRPIAPTPRPVSRATPVPRPATPAPRPISPPSRIPAPSVAAAPPPTPRPAIVPKPEPQPPVAAAPAPLTTPEPSPGPIATPLIAWERIDPVVWIALALAAALAALFGFGWWWRRRPLRKREERRRDREHEVFALGTDPATDLPPSRETASPMAAAERPAPSIPSPPAVASPPVAPAEAPAAAPSMPRPIAPRRPEPSLSPPSSPAVPRPSAATGQRAQASLDVALVAKRAGTNLLSASVEYQLTVRNTGDAAATGIRLDMRLLGVGRNHDTILAALYAGTIERPIMPLFDLAPGDAVTLDGMAMHPKETIELLGVGTASTAVFVPLVSVHLRYGGALHGESQLAHTFMVGVDRGDGAKLQPFRRDGARMFDRVTVLDYAVVAGG